jgi:hypothetical protein
MNMAKARLLQAVCTVAILAAAPAFAQTDTRPAGTGSSVNSPTDDNTPPTSGTMTPASKMGSSGESSSSAAMHSQSTHRSAMAGHGMMHTKSDTSQDAAVDELNNQSYQAAQRGQTLSSSNMRSGGMTAPSGSASMHDMSGGSTPEAPGTSSAPGAGGK